MNHKKAQPCGSWSSPISAALVAGSLHELGQLRASLQGLYWVEQFPEQKGRRAIMCCDASGYISELTDRNFNVRNRVHEYGGGDYCIHHDTLYFSNDRDQRLYRKDRAHSAEAITPKPEKPMAWRYADSVITPDGQFLICVRETHVGEHEVINDIVAIATDGSQAVSVLATGADFYAAPRISHDGQQLLYVCWNHPQMPWDGTELYVANFQNGACMGAAKKIAGHQSESIYQPQFAKNGDIYFISDRSNWWNLYCYSQDEIKPVFSIDAEIGYPAWIFATEVYAFINDHDVVCIVNENGKHYLAKVQQGKVQKILTEYHSFSPTLAVQGDYLYCIGASGAMAPALLKIHVQTDHVEVIHSSSTLLLDVDYLSLPELIQFETEHQLMAYAYYYAPQNLHAKPEESELPPLIVLSHGGPTAAVSAVLNLKIQYWTSRGFAVVDVNYGGSTGYGRDYRERLRLQWGVVDVADCVNAAKYLVQQGKADAARLIIKGSSAGGFTTLAALTFYDIFAAGVSYYGVADLTSLVADTHKFEAHYLEELVGPYPEQKALYRERSPLYHAEKISCPILFLQGLEDKVVPPSQAEMMMLALDKKKTPYAYVVFAHEQHGFRDSQSIIKALEAELSFYAQIFKFIPDDELDLLPIKHLFL